MSKVDVMIVNNDCCHYVDIIQDDYDVILTGNIDYNVEGRLLYIKYHSMDFNDVDNVDKKIIDTTYEEILDHTDKYKQLILTEPNVIVMIYNDSGVCDEKIKVKFNEIFKFQFGVYK